MIPFQKLDARAKTPSKGSEGAAGFDLFALDDVILPANATHQKVATGIALDLGALKTVPPFSFYGRVAPRSGHAARNGINVLAGVIDEDYRGEIFVILTNPTSKPVHISANKAIAQIIPTVYLRDCSMHEVSELSSTERGAGGFGSTDA